MKLRPAKALGVVVRNLVLHREPVYALEEWAAPFDLAVLGLDASQVHLLNDDRVGGALLSLFDADRASLLNKLVLGAVDEFSTFPSVVRQATGTAPSAVTVRMNTSCNRSGLWSFECPRLAAMVGLAPRVTPVAVA